MKIKATVVIPTYNEEKFIERCLKSLCSQTVSRSEYEIIVVDGYSTDKTREIAAKYADKVIYQVSKGVGGARNDGAKEAKGEILVFTDADVIFPRDWLEKILSYFEKANDVIAVCGPDEPLERSGKLVTFYKLVNSFSKLLHRMGIVGTRGTNTAVRRDVFFKIGGYTDYPLCDDVELGLRLRKLGKVVYSDEVKVLMSARRFNKYGILRVLKEWVKGDVMLLLGRRTVGSYARQSY
ncbi:MAG: glycosyltransferase family 2 protein [Candidatus Methanomethylicota archaeon]|uniref:Glycosyltransferase family 2 protein n=1 Tax=Thermoproteota archaeon TaxID=2056631 RepID=A0A497EP08_9CREN|nr:MAG: glycosyltransferase family 2 protein [Candidatus Verstraetearchaeota archaeon]